MMMEQQFSMMDKIIDGLYLGNIQGASNLPHLKKKGITHILQVAAGFQPFFPGEFQYMVINVLDMPFENLMRHFKPAVDFIKNAIRSGGTVLVHCFAGISRSASVVIAYLMKELGLPMLDALTYTRKRRPIVFPNPGFQKQLFEFEKHLRQNNQKAMIEYQEKKRKRIIEEQNKLTTSVQQELKQRVAAGSYDRAVKQPNQKTLETAKAAYQMYESNKPSKPLSSKPLEKATMSFNATMKDGTIKQYFTQAKTSEAQSPSNRPLTQNGDRREKLKEKIQANSGAEKTLKYSQNGQPRNFDLSANQDMRVKKLLSSTETSPQRLPGNNYMDNTKEAQKIKQQMSQTQAAQILGFQGHVNLQSSYKRDFDIKSLELAVSMNQKKQAASNTPSRPREISHERNQNELFKNLPQQQRSTTLIQGNDQSKNQASLTQQQFYNSQKDKLAGRYSDAAVMHDSKKPPLMIIQKTVPQEQRGGSSSLQTDARRLAALEALPQSYMKQIQDRRGPSEQNNIPMHPKLIDPSRKGEIVLTPPPNGLKSNQYSSSLNNSAGKEATQKLILQEKGGFILKQHPSQTNPTATSSFDNRNLRDATQRKRY